MKLKNYIGVLMFTISIICGLFMLFFGLKDTYNLNKNTKNYKEVEGYFINYQVYSTNTEGTTYSLTYSYVVDGKEYSITTNSGSTFIPKNNSTRMIKYNPNNPQEAIISGGTTNYLFIFMGFMFTFVPLFILFGMLNTFGYFQNIFIHIIEIGAGLFFLLVGFLTIYLMTGTFSISKLFKSFEFPQAIPLLIPILLIITGVYQLIRISFFKKSKKI